MDKRLKLKISKLIPSFHSCRSNDTSTLPSNPLPSSAKSKLTYLHFAHAKQRPLPLPPSQSTTARSSIPRQLSSAFTSVGWGFRSRSTPSHHHPKQTPEFQWEKEEKWHVVAKVCEERACPHRKNCDASISGGCGFDGEALPTLLPPRPSLSAEKKKKKRKKKKKKRITKKKAIPRLRISNSSAESGFFCSEGFGDIDDEETSVLVSSSSSSESNPHLQTIREKPSTMRREKKRSATKKGVYSPECESPARLSVFQWLIPCRVEGKVRESFAVVKRSEDPYKDFKRSMMEMILAKEMWDETDLEQLLHCFISLNDKQHHGIIIEAFSEIWEALFCRKPNRR